jgi:hypothetical protein
MHKRFIPFQISLVSKRSEPSLESKGIIAKVEIRQYFLVKLVFLQQTYLVTKRRLVEKQYSINGNLNITKYTKVNHAMPNL